MNSETLLRAAAVVAAVALVAQPYWAEIARAAGVAGRYARDHGSTLARFAAAGLLLAAVWGKVSLPVLPQVPQPTVTVQTPSPEMQDNVAAIAKELRTLPMSDRLVWASVWKKAAMVAAADPTAKEPAFTDTRSLRGFTALAVDIAWRRIAGREPGGQESLREAVEAAYEAVLGSDVVPVTRDTCSRYAEFASAVAWAGLNGE